MYASDFSSRSKIYNKYLFREQIRILGKYPQPQIIVSAHDEINIQ